MDRHKNKRHARPLVGAHRRLYRRSQRDLCRRVAAVVRQGRGVYTPRLRSRSFLPGAGAVVPGGNKRNSRRPKRSARLFVSHYNYYRNFENSDSRYRDFKEESAPAIHPADFSPAKLASRIIPASTRRTKLRSWCGNSSSAGKWSSWAQYLILLCTICIGVCDVYATPAYAETFAHPLVEGDGQ